MPQTQRRITPFRLHAGHLDLQQLSRHPREEGPHHAPGMQQTDAKDRSDPAALRNYPRPQLPVLGPVNQGEVTPFPYSLPRWISGKESACHAGDASSISGSRRSPEEGNGNPLQYTFLGNPMDRGAWQATIHGVVKE